MSTPSIKTAALFLCMPAATALAPNGGVYYRITRRPSMRAPRSAAALGPSWFKQIDRFSAFDEAFDRMAEALADDFMALDDDFFAGAPFFRADASLSRRRAELRLEAAKAAEADAKARADEAAEAAAAASKFAAEAEAALEAATPKKAKDSSETEAALKAAPAEATAAAPEAAPAEAAAAAPKAAPAEAASKDSSEAKAEAAPEPAAAAPLAYSTTTYSVTENGKTRTSVRKTYKGADGQDTVLEQRSVREGDKYYLESKKSGEDAKYEGFADGSVAFKDAFSEVWGDAPALGAPAEGAAPEEASSGVKPYVHPTDASA
mmetsp:Transcript_8207/g.24584  ORF Transcript_8207/g.24584 Transcript_8207/m.24584 type:complete len:319 (-) Transcript_8207:108-1064(-)|eukprot:CAMPEP_0119259664 /NCGR_PEP_ID=MMETSP1329-20130426/395_1 /TAXON_ID=114041 /ORGANISM="Genus nov. species nov., Strain RCC1024" /LENGTH=318 /DNA_ID=CAMNT_0007259061 /DNA_START=101 /DNA_END=1057 /DNA_ORIENTATION=-